MTDVDGLVRDDVDPPQPVAVSTWTASRLTPSTATHRGPVTPATWTASRVTTSTARRAPLQIRDGLELDGVVHE